MGVGAIRWRSATTSISCDCSDNIWMIESQHLMPDAPEASTTRWRTAQQKTPGVQPETQYEPKFFEACKLVWPAGSGQEGTGCSWL